MFALGIRYLCGRAVAAHPADRERAEWPPHPDRVFMALVAAHFQTGANPAERAALRWLEEQPPPALKASESESRDPVVVFVPVNDAALPRRRPGHEPSEEQASAGLSLLPQFRSRQPRRFPAAIPHEPDVFLIWPDATPADPVREVLVALGRKVTCVGHSSSLVQVWVELTPPAPTWQPAAAGPARHRLRVPGKGRLDELEAWFNAEDWTEYLALTRERAGASGKRKAALQAQLRERFGDSAPAYRRPAPSLWQGYDRVDALAPASVPSSGSCFAGGLLVLRRVEGPPLGLESTLQITRALRDALMAHCPVQPPPEWLSGHAPPDGRPSVRPHLAFLPLPHVGREHADGHLLGLGLALPQEVSADEQARCWRGLLYDEYGLARTLPPLRLGRLGVWSLELDEREARPAALRPATWTGPARRWATVTPVALDRYPKGSDREAAVEATIRRACVHVGLPAPAGVIAAKVSMFEGAPTVQGFPPMERKAGGSFLHVHAVLTFDAPVSGPVLLGAGRFRGYGLCRPLAWEDEP